MTSDQVFADLQGRFINFSNVAVLKSDLARERSRDDVSFKATKHDSRAIQAVISKQALLLGTMTNAFHAFEPSRNLRVVDCAIFI